VLNFANVQPAYARLVGRAGIDIKKTITITREEAFPFKILNVKTRSGKEIAVHLKEFNEAGKSGYLLTIENQKANPGRYADAVILTTDSKIKPTLTIPVYGQIISTTPQPAKPTPGKNTQGG
jgi:hypothetical protein